MGILATFAPKNLVRLEHNTIWHMSTKSVLTNTYTVADPGVVPLGTTLGSKDVHRFQWTSGKTATLRTALRSRKLHLPWISLQIISKTPACGVKTWAFSGCLGSLVHVHGNDVGVASTKGAWSKISHAFIQLSTTLLEFLDPPLIYMYIYAYTMYLTAC